MHEASPLRVRHDLKGRVQLHDQPQTWHYGLVAQYWAEFNVAKPEELSYFRTCIERFGQPALDVACGTGRLLLPLLQAGLEVDGSDLSPDMLSLCRAKAERSGLSPRLYAQAMHALDLPRTYRTIYICDAFGIGGKRWQDSEGLRRIYSALDPGGALVLNIYAQYTEAGKWQSWVKEKRRELPAPWPETGWRRQASDGSAYELRTRLVDLDPLEQIKTIQIRTGLWRDGQLVAEEEGLLQEILYFKGELILMLNQAGFDDVTVYGGYSEAPATAEDEMLVFVARK